MGYNNLMMMREGNEMTDAFAKKVFVVVAEIRAWHCDNSSNVAWFPTEEAAWQWIDEKGNKQRYDFDVIEIASADSFAECKSFEKKE